MKNRIVFILEYFYPSKRNDSKLLTSIVQKLSASKTKIVSVITTSELNDHKEFDSVDDIIRLGTSSLNEKSIILRIIKFFILTSKLFIKSVLYLRKDDEVFITTNPAFLLPALVILKKIKKFKIILLIYDVFPENLIASNIIQKGFFFNTLLRIYNWAYLNSDTLIVIGRDMREIVKNKINRKDNIRLIENWCDYKAIIPSDKSSNKIIKKYNLEDKKVFLFAGNLGRVQGIENILQAAEMVKNKQFMLLFIGDGVLKNHIVQYIKQKNIQNIIYAGSFPPEQQNIFLNACDISIVSLCGSMYGLGVPSKSYYNMAAQKPLLYIGNTDSELSQVINEHYIGWTCEPDNSEKLAQLIDDICNKSDVYEQMGVNSRHIVKNYYSQEVILKKYNDLLN